MKNLIFAFILSSTPAWAALTETYEQEHLKASIEMYLTQNSLAGLEGLKAELAQIHAELKITLKSGEKVDLPEAKLRIAEGATVSATFRNGESKVYIIKIAPTDEALSLIRQGMQGVGASSVKTSR